MKNLGTISDPKDLVTVEYLEEHQAEGSQSDWYENDDTKSAYVKNRTHWEENLTETPVKNDIIDRETTWPIQSETVTGNVVSVYADDAEGYAQAKEMYDYLKAYDGDEKFTVEIDGEQVRVDGIKDVLSFTETTLPPSENWQSVCYGDGKFVAVAYNSDKAAYSEDGINWTETTLPSSKQWRSVCYGDGKFVAVASYSDKAIYSEDGINWTETTLPSSKSWHSVCYGDGKFVAVAHNSGKAAYSEDGINWTETTLPSSKAWLSVCCGDSKFVAVANNSDKAIYSEDGINWTETTLPPSESWRSVCYGNGKFVAVAYNSDKAIYSEDGINWIGTTLPSSKEWLSVCYGDSKFVAVAATANSVGAAYSEDGINWTETTLPSSGDWLSVCYGDSKFVAVADYSDKAACGELAYKLSSDDCAVLSTSDALYFTSDSASTDKIVSIYDGWYECHKLDRKFLPEDIVSDWAENDPDSLDYVKNRTHWEEANLTETPVKNDVVDHTSDWPIYDETIPENIVSVYSNDSEGYAQAKEMYDYLAEYDGEGKFTLDIDGEKISLEGIEEHPYVWSVSTFPFTSVSRNSICYGNGKFVSMGSYSDTAAIYSEDGINWGVSDLHKQAHYGVCYGNGMFISPDYLSNRWAYSEDGIHWTIRNISLDVKKYWSSICYGDGKFIVVANESDVAAYSEDGINWTTVSMPAELNWESVCYGDGKFVAISETTMAAYSEDGINWIEMTTGNGSSVCYGDGKFVSVGSSQASYSEDGIHWINIYPQDIAHLDLRGVCYGDEKFVAIEFNNKSAVIGSAYSLSSASYSILSSENNLYLASESASVGKPVSIYDGWITYHQLDPRYIPNIYVPLHDEPSGVNAVYGVDPEGNQKMIPLLEQGYSYSIPVRKLNGTFEVGTASNDAEVANFGDIKAWINDQYGAHVLWQVAANNGLEATETKARTTSWQLEGIDMTPYKYVLAYIRACEGSNNDQEGASLVIRIDLDANMLTPRSGRYVGGTATVYPNDNGVKYMVSAVIDDTKTKFAFNYCMANTTGTTALDRDGKCWKLEGYKN